MPDVLAGSVFALSTVLLVACTTDSAAQIPLNSERILKRFGSYGVDVRVQSQHWRVSELYSGAADARRTRTLAVVEFLMISTDDLGRADAAIRDGASIGSTLADAGWQVRKTTLWTGSLPDALATNGVHTALCTEPGTAIAAHQYVLSAVRDGRQVDYARITEIHDPDYLTVADLERLRGSMVLSASLDREGLARLSNVTFHRASEDVPCD